MYAQIASWLLFKRYTNYIVQNPGMENIMVILHTQLDQHIRTTLEHTKYKLFSFYNILYNVLSDSVCLDGTSTVTSLYIFVGYLM